MKRLILSFLLFVIVSIGYGASGKVTLTGTTDASVASASNTYANSQVDTVIWTRDGSVSAISFAAHFKDSVSVTSCVIRRIVHGTLMAAVAADTVANLQPFASTTDGSAGSTVFSDGKSVTGLVTLTPLADQYLFIVTYAGSANGVTTPTVIYEVIKQFSRR